MERVWQVACYQGNPTKATSCPAIAAELKGLCRWRTTRWQYKWCTVATCCKSTAVKHNFAGP
eukprot:12910224-Prorocentrum_lima.AAC.1